VPEREGGCAGAAGGGGGEAGGGRGLMKENQAAGYLFEVEILELLRESGFVNVETKTLEGRGTSHQIDAYGVYSIPIPFTYPIRLIAEAKCYEKTIGIHQIRSFFGVITDISENYFVKKGATNTNTRYLDTGCFFSANSFTLRSQNFAWAHNIFLVSFSGIMQMNTIIKNIRDFLKEPAIKESLKMGKQNLIANYQIWKNPEQPQDKIHHPEYPSIVFGIIDKVCPVVLVGNKGWHKRILIPPDTDKVNGIKISRKSQPGSILFEIVVYDKNGDLETIYFTIPTRIAKKITGRIDKTETGEKVFDLDIPLVSWKEGQSIRRIITIEVTLPEERRKDRLRKIKGRAEPKKELKREDMVIMEK